MQDPCDYNTDSLVVELETSKCFNLNWNHSCLNKYMASLLLEVTIGFYYNFSLHISFAS